MLPFILHNFKGCMPHGLTRQYRIAAQHYLERVAGMVVDENFHGLPMADMLEKPDAKNAFMLHKQDTKGMSARLSRAFMVTGGSSIQLAGYKRRKNNRLIRDVELCKVRHSTKNLHHLHDSSDLFLITKDMNSV